MKKLLKYTLVNGKIPPEIEDGGYFYDEPYIYGISVHMEESYTPEGMEWISLEDFEVIIAASNEFKSNDIGIESIPITREVFESNHDKFYYKTSTPKDRITALEDLLAEIMEGV